MNTVNVASLVNLLGFAVGAALYAMLLAMVLRRPRKNEHFDFLLVATAIRCHVSVAALHGLRQLRELLGEAVPDEPLFALAARRAPLRERLEMRVVGRRSIPWLDGFATRGVRWLRISHQQGWLARAAG